MNVFGKLLDLVIAIFMFFAIPLCYLNQKIEVMEYQKMYQLTYTLVETVKERGEVSREQIYQYYKEAESLRSTTNIQLYYEYQVMIPNGSDKIVRTNEEIIEYLEENGDMKMRKSSYFEVQIQFSNSETYFIVLGGTIR